MELTKGELNFLIDIIRDYEIAEIRKTCSRDFFREEMLENIRSKVYTALKTNQMPKIPISGVL